MNGKISWAVSRKVKNKKREIEKLFGWAVLKTHNFTYLCVPLFVFTVLFLLSLNVISGFFYVFLNLAKLVHLQMLLACFLIYRYHLCLLKKDCICLEIPSIAKLISGIPFSFSHKKKTWLRKNSTFCNLLGQVQLSHLWSKQGHVRHCRFCGGRRRTRVASVDSNFWFRILFFFFLLGASGSLSCQMSDFLFCINEAREISSTENRPFAWILSNTKLERKHTIWKKARRSNMCTFDEKLQDTRALNFSPLLQLL